MQLGVQGDHYQPGTALQADNSATEAKGMHIGVALNGVQLHTVRCGGTTVWVGGSIPARHWYNPQYRPSIANGP